MSLHKVTARQGGRRSSGVCVGPQGENLGTRSGKVRAVGEEGHTHVSQGSRVGVLPVKGKKTQNEPELSPFFCPKTHAARWDKNIGQCMVVGKEVGGVRQRQQKPGSGRGKVSLSNGSELESTYMQQGAGSHCRSANNP